MKRGLMYSQPENTRNVDRDDLRTSQPYDPRTGQPYDPRTGQPYDPQYYHQAPAPKHTSAMGIVALVLGIIALLLSFFTITSIPALILAILGIIFGLVGLISTVRGTRTGKGIAIAALILNVIAMILAIILISSCTAAVNDAVDSLNESINGPAVTSTSASDQSSATDLAVGTTVELANGLRVTVDAVDLSQTNYDGSALTVVLVSYVNGGSDAQSFNIYDWKGQDTDGVQSYPTYVTSSDYDRLSSGTLAEGGTVSGALFFKGTVTQVLYFSSMLTTTPTATWDLG